MYIIKIDITFTKLWNYFVITPLDWKNRRYYQQMFEPWFILCSKSNEQDSFSLRAQYFHEKSKHFLKYLKNDPHTYDRNY